MRDNGMLNSVFLRRCKKIGYRYAGDLIPFWRDADEFRRLSAQERDDRNEEALFAAGYSHKINMPIEAVGTTDRKTIETLLRNDHKMKPWTHLYPSSWCSVFYFSDELDAIHFRLSSQ